MRIDVVRIPEEERERIRKIIEETLIFKKTSIYTPKKLIKF